MANQLVGAGLIAYLVARHGDAGVHHFDVGYGTLVKGGVTVGKQLIKELISRTRLQNKANCTYSLRSKL